MNTIKLSSQLSDEESDKLGGSFIGNDSFDTLIKESCDVYKPNGEILCKFRKCAISEKDCLEFYPFLRRASTANRHRGMAAGKVAGRARGFRIRKDGKISRTSIAIAPEVNSGVIGFMDRGARNPYCRLTAYTLQNWPMFQKLKPFIQKVDSIFKVELPDRYENQRQYILKTNPEFYIEGTSFTTITVNRNFRTAVHKDRGDLKCGFGVMSALTKGFYEGFFICWPKYRIAVDLRMGDLVLADVHEWHANTPFIGSPKKYERISLVFYYREKMTECGAPVDEVKMAKNLRGSVAIA